MIVNEDLDAEQIMRKVYGPRTELEVSVASTTLLPMDGQISLVPHYPLMAEQRHRPGSANLAALHDQDGNKPMQVPCQMDMQHEEVRPVPHVPLTPILPAGERVIEAHGPSFAG